MNIEDFYSADERRRQSAEIELGTNWHDAIGNRYELSWVEDTGELYAMLEMVPEATSYTPFGDVEVGNLESKDLVVTIAGYLATRDEMEKVLEGWQAEMAQPDGITWLAGRLREHGVPASAPASSA